MEKPNNSTHVKPNIDFRANQMKRYSKLPREDKRVVDGVILGLLYKAGLAPEIGKSEKSNT